VARSLKKITYFFAFETDGVLWNAKGSASPWPMWGTLFLLAVANVAYVAVLAGCIVAMVSAGGALSSLFGLLVLYLTAIAVVFLGDPRYHYPLVPLGTILASKAYLVDLPAVRDGLRANNRRARVIAWRSALALCLFGGMMLFNLYLKSLESQMLLP
jgi:hypothetical protein